MLILNRLRLVLQYGVVPPLCYLLTIWVRLWEVILDPQSLIALRGNLIHIYQRGKTYSHPISAFSNLPTYSLLGKWIWWYHNEPTQLWRMMIDCKYVKTNPLSICYRCKFISARSHWFQIIKMEVVVFRNMKWSKNIILVTSMESQWSNYPPTS